MSDIAELVAMFGNQRRRRYVEPEIEALLLGRVAGPETKLIVGFARGMLVNVARGVPNPEQHKIRPARPSLPCLIQACRRVPLCSRSYMRV